MGLFTGKGVRSNWGADHLDVMARQFKWNDSIRETKLYNPIFQAPLLDDLYDPSKIDITYLPINIKVGSEATPLGLAVVEELIRRSPHRIISKKCTCRDAHNCEKFPAEDTGCIHIGNGTWEESDELCTHATVEEAIAHLHKCVDMGLVPFIGRVMYDHIYWDVAMDNPFLTVCMCCECCCTNFKAYRSGIQDRSEIAFNGFKPLTGWKVSIDAEKCVGCNTCNKVCFTHCIGVPEGGKVSVWDASRCKACGQCELNCPTKAITVSLDDPKKAVDELLARLDPKVGGLPLDEIKIDF